MDVGLRSAPARAQPGPAAPRDAGPWRRGGVVPLALAAGVIAATAWVLLSSVAGAPVVSPGEAAFAVRAFAVNRFGFGAAQLPWHDGGLAALQVAGYETVSGALRRATTVVTAAREAMVVASLLAAAALTLAARRLRLSGPATVAVPLTFGLAPAAVLLHRTADPAQLGVLWACVALALAGGDARRTGVAVGSACYLAAAAATSPLVLIALVPLFTTLLWAGDLGRLRGRWRWLAAAAGLLGWAGLVALADRGDLARPAASVPPLNGLDVVLAVAAVAAGIAGVRSRWLRPLALALLGTAVAAAVAEPVRGSLLIVALPVAAVVLSATADAAVAALSARLSRSAAAGGHRVAWLPATATALLAVAVAGAWVPAARALGGDGQPARAAVDDARDWVLTNLPSRPRLAVDDVVWAALVQSGYPAEQLAATGDLGPEQEPWPDGWSEAQYVVGRDSALRAEGDRELIGPARDHSAPVATFGSGADQVTARRVQAGTDAITRAQADASTRIDAGTALAGNPRLGLQPGAAERLRGGDVDARAHAVLAAITGQHSLAVADFPVITGEDPEQPRRLITVTAIDGQLVAPRANAVGLLDQWLRAQQPPYRPAGTELSQVDGRAVLVLRYDALGSTGVLPP